MIISKKTKMEELLSKAVPRCVLCVNAKMYCRVKERSVAALVYLRSGDAKNFPWRENPTADLLLPPNL